MTPDQFVTDAVRTESRIPNVTINSRFFTDLTNSIIALGTILDQIKKNTFYKKPYNEKEIIDCLNTVRANTEAMKEDVEIGYWKFPELIEQTKINPRHFHSVVGIATEAVELLQAIKLDSDKVDEVNLREEFGDLLWYIAIGVDETGGNIEAVMDRVIAKLRTRFPDKFTNENANNRDLVKERLILECKHPDDAIRAQRPGAGEPMQPSLCTKCGQEVEC